MFHELSGKYMGFERELKESAILVCEYGIRTTFTKPLGERSNSKMNYYFYCFLGSQNNRPLSVRILREKLATEEYG